MKRKKQRIAIAAAGIFLVAAAAFLILKPPADPLAAVPSELAEQVTLPLVPFPGYARNEQQWKGDVSYLIYREAPWDVAFTFIPYDQWSGEEPLEET